MRLYVLDDETEKPLVCRTGPLDYDYQAEQWVKDFAEGREGGTGRPLISFILLDDSGIRCVWTRSVEDAVAKKLPEITKVATRFSGEWQRSVEPSDFFLAEDPYELVALARHDRP
jgi:hypothetical protein